MTIKFDYNSFLIMDGEKLLSITTGRSELCSPEAEAMA